MTKSNLLFLLLDEFLNPWLHSVFLMEYHFFKVEFRSLKARCRMQALPCLCKNDN